MAPYKQLFPCILEEIHDNKFYKHIFVYVFSLIKWDLMVIILDNLHFMRGGGGGGELQLIYRSK